MMASKQDLDPNNILLKYYWRPEYFWAKAATGNYTAFRKPEPEPTLAVYQTVGSQIGAQAGAQAGTQTGAQTGAQAGGSCEMSKSGVAGNVSRFMKKVPPRLEKTWIDSRTKIPVAMNTALTGAQSKVSKAGTKVTKAVFGLQQQIKRPMSGSRGSRLVSKERDAGIYQPLNQQQQVPAPIWDNAEAPVAEPHQPGHCGSSMQANSVSYPPGPSGSSQPRSSNAGATTGTSDDDDVETFEGLVQADESQLNLAIPDAASSDDKLDDFVSFINFEGQRPRAQLSRARYGVLNGGRGEFVKHTHHADWSDEGQFGDVYETKKMHVHETRTLLVANRQT